MSFWKKLFGKGKDVVPPVDEANESTNESKWEPDPADVAAREKLDKILAPLIRPCTIIKVKAATRPPENSQLRSHFGGQPYFEEGDKWPTTKADSNVPLDFICQIFNDEKKELPDNIKLIQFFYDWEEGPWDSDDDGWLVKIHKNLSEQKLITIDKPSQLEKSKYCEIDFEPSKSLPDYEGLYTYSERANDLANKIVEKEDGDADIYNDWILSKHIGKNNVEANSQLAGYPNWIQGAETPKDANGNLMPLLFQIDSETNADIMWGDVGTVYFFYDESQDKVHFTLQCC